MGGKLTTLCKGKFTATNEDVEEEANYETPAPTKASGTEVRAIVVWCDYGWEPLRSQGWAGPPSFGGKLDTDQGANVFKQHLQASGVTDITEISNQQASADAVLKAIASVGQRCDEDDVFILYYTGHGAPVQDTSGEEEDGMDEAMCLPSAGGQQCDQSTWLTDDDIAEAVTSNVQAERILFICDCCHSGSICDFSSGNWAGMQAISITGCKDSQESAATGSGGAFTKSICAASKNLMGTGASVGAVYNETLTQGQQFIPAGHPQDITIECAPGCTPDTMAWPLDGP